MPNVFASSSTCETVSKRGGRLMGVLPGRPLLWMATDFGRLSWQHGGGPSPARPDHGLSSSGGPLYDAAPSAARRSKRGNPCLRDLPVPQCTVGHGKDPNSIGRMPCTCHVARCFETERLRVLG